MDPYPPNTTGHKFGRFVEIPAYGLEHMLAKGSTEGSTASDNHRRRIPETFLLTLSARIGGTQSAISRLELSLSSSCRRLSCGTTLSAISVLPV
jgi:hypothetical protein